MRIKLRIQMPLDSRKIDAVIFHSWMVTMKQDGESSEEKKNPQTLTVVFQFNNPLRWEMASLASGRRLHFRRTRATSIVVSISWLQPPALCAEDAKLRHSPSLQRKF